MKHGFSGFCNMEKTLFSRFFTFLIPRSTGQWTFCVAQNDLKGDLTRALNQKLKSTWYNLEDFLKIKSSILLFLSPKHGRSWPWFSGRSWPITDYRKHLWNWEWLEAIQYKDIKWRKTCFSLHTVLFASYLSSVSSNHSWIARQQINRTTDTLSLHPISTPVKWKEDSEAGLQCPLAENWTDSWLISLLKKDLGNESKGLHKIWKYSILFDSILVFHLSKLTYIYAFRRSNEY